MAGTRTSSLRPMYVFVSLVVLPHMHSCHNHDHGQRGLILETDNLNQYAGPDPGRPPGAAPGPPPDRSDPGPPPGVGWEARVVRVRRDVGGDGGTLMPTPDADPTSATPGSGSLNPDRVIRTRLPGSVVEQVTEGHASASVSDGEGHGGGRTDRPSSPRHHHSDNPAEEGYADTTPEPGNHGHVAYTVAAASPREGAPPPSVTDPNAYIHKLFAKYGDGEVLTFEGFEHLLQNLGLAQVVIEDHDIDDHFTGDNAFHPLHDHSHNHGNLHADDGNDGNDRPALDDHRGVVPDLVPVNPDQMYPDLEDDPASHVMRDADGERDDSSHSSSRAMEGVEWRKRRRRARRDSQDSRDFPDSQEAEVFLPGDDTRSGSPQRTKIAEEHSAAIANNEHVPLDMSAGNSRTNLLERSRSKEPSGSPRGSTLGGSPSDASSSGYKMDPLNQIFRAKREADVPDMCLSPASLYEQFAQVAPDNRIHVSSFLALCPALVFQLDLSQCRQAPPPPCKMDHAAVAEHCATYHHLRHRHGMTSPDPGHEEEHDHDDDHEGHDLDHDEGHALDLDHDGGHAGHEGHNLDHDGGRDHTLSLAEGQDLDLDVDDHDSHSSDSDDDEKRSFLNVPGIVWGYSLLSCFVISAVGLLCVAVIPIMHHSLYHHLLQLLVALAIGSLVGDALLHLLPHAMVAKIPGRPSHGGSHDNDGSHDHDGSHDNDDDEGHVHDMTSIWLGLVAFAGVYFFFLTERLMGIITKRRRKKNKKKRRQSPDNLYLSPEEGQSQVGAKLSNHQEQVASCEQMLMMVHPSKDVKKFIEEAHDEVHQNCDPGVRDSWLPKDQGHSHDHHSHGGHNHSAKAPGSVASVAWMVIMGDGLHNFSDGLAIGAAFAASLTSGLSTSIAVICHELPHELGDFAMLLRAGMSVKQAMIYNCVSSVLCLIGLVVGIAIGNVSNSSQWIFALIAGMFIYVALVDMLPELTSVEPKEGENPCVHLLLHNVGILLGGSIMLIIAIYEDDIKLPDWGDP